MKAPTPAPRSVSTDVYGWSFAALPSPRTLGCWPAASWDDALGLTETANECLQESRGGRNVQHRLVGLLRQSVYSRLAGHEDTNDAERLAQDPTMRIIVGRRDTDRPAASTNTMSRFETGVLTQDGNVEGLDRLNAEWVDGAMSRTPHRRVIMRFHPIGGGPKTTKIDKKHSSRQESHPQLDRPAIDWPCRT